MVHYFNTLWSFAFPHRACKRDQNNVYKAARVGSFCLYLHGGLLTGLNISWRILRWEFLAFRCIYDVHHEGIFRYLARYFFTTIHGNMCLHDAQWMQPNEAELIKTERVTKIFNHQCMRITKGILIHVIQDYGGTWPRSLHKASRDTDGIQTQAACVAAGHSTKELSRQLNNLSILSRYRTELKEQYHESAWHCNWRGFQDYWFNYKNMITWPVPEFFAKNGSIKVDYSCAMSLVGLLDNTVQSSIARTETVAWDFLWFHPIIS